MALWFVYVVRCRDDSLYTGITTDVAARLSVHNAGAGARYTRARLPVELLWVERKRSRSTALRREASIKRLSRPEKLKLVALEKTSPRRDTRGGTAAGTQGGTEGGTEARLAPHPGAPQPRPAVPAATAAGSRRTRSPALRRSGPRGPSRAPDARARARS